MKLFIITTVFVLGSLAQVPSKNYLPQNQGGQIGGGYQPHLGAGGLGGHGNQRPQQAVEKNAQIVKQDQTVNLDGSYNFGYETSNGIRAEESSDSSNSQGGFAYKGDDGNIYTVTYTAGEGGFRPQGEHLPVAPPTPEAILEALRKNEQDEAAGIFDDGKYHPEQSGGSQHGGRPSGGFGSSGGQFGSHKHQGSFSGTSGYQY